MGVRGVSTDLELTARPAIAPPDQAIAGAVEALARAECSREEVLSAAVTLGPAAIPSLLAAMVHPPCWDGCCDPFAWIFRRQTTAARLIAACEDPWERSTRKRALESLLYGPLDWTTTASIVALVEIATHSAALRETIVGMLVAELEHPVNPLAWTCLLHPLTVILERLPLDGSVLRTLARLRR